ncbi:MAG: hypothetical protein HWD60_17650 [Defluviicoccus sp.]|nr:MAG: hypothetical protein HWD60_17650 [Defluviicoccus sp.]
MAIINGDAGNNRLTGTAGADQINGQAGNDTLTGLAGNDIYKFGGSFGTDTVVEQVGGGNDLLQILRVSLRRRYGWWGLQRRPQHHCRRLWFDPAGGSLDDRRCRAAPDRDRAGDVADGRADDDRQQLQRPHLRHHVRRCHQRCHGKRYAD